MEQQPEVKLYTVEVEMIKNDMYCYKGQIINEVVEASSTEQALEKLLKANTISRANVSVIVNKLYE